LSHFLKKLYQLEFKANRKDYEISGKGEVIPLHAMEAHGVKGGTAPAHS
jgi:hypothetical protein